MKKNKAGRGDKEKSTGCYFRSSSQRTKDDEVARSRNKQGEAHSRQRK